MSQQQSTLRPDIFNSPLDELREMEWQWLNPLEPLPSGLSKHRFIDRITRGWFSRRQLAKKDIRGLSHDPSHRFAWECCAIAINNDYAEAYALRALDGSNIFHTMGQVERLLGWSRDGSETYYDTDKAIVDIAVALHFFPDWPWGIYMQGFLALDLARVAPTGPIFDPEWFAFARTKFEKSISLSNGSEWKQNIQNCRDMLADMEATGNT